ncbi:HNH endonuclease signature motif containing protein [Mycobacterium sp. 1274761.0]|uniref:HNH endonuclease signature motif containing protein n=1 Tax=Mycobacterium sp. 1274761.0 TaxID=1834077 RepID=UPI0007FF299B|nr:HNH endonuclease signature motif containing protein [Mycobacterium sp. 1274761.0]OBK77289.1 hypothetical protein A5651_04805 [Mycobacterium sp. 1274761.0]
MFEGVDDAGLVATIEEATCAENAAAALRSAAIGALLQRRLPEPDDDERALWACDGFDSTAAEVAAAMNISHGKACGQLRIAESLRDHLPTVAALFVRGELSARVVGTITWRTRLIVEDTAWAQIDEELCRRAQTWGPMADDRLSSALDAVIYQFDPAAVIAVKQRARGRDVTVGNYEDEAGTVSIFGRLMATDGALLEKKIAAIAATVCADDPRSPGERRSDALAALADLNDHLTCRCANPDCPVKDQSAQRSSVVISVIADQPAISAARTDSDSDGAAVMLDDKSPVPTPLLSDLLAKGATVKPLAPPCDEKPEPRYRPSAKLAAFVRARDLTCRFPGCRVPASRCDIDHVVPYPIGGTHPSDLVCLCRKHHLLKTFWVGDWSLTLAADGSATWTSPTGKTYVTHSGSRALFPDWDTTTAQLPTSESRTPPEPLRWQMMPVRKQARAAQRKARIDAERKHDSTGPPV